MKLIVGLGNPGPQYEKTRHNAGFMAIDRLIARHAAGGIVRQRFSGACAECTIGEQKVLLLKPLRFMNCSGSSVAEAVGFFKLDLAADVLVLVDDYALPLGAIRLRSEGSAGGHNGLSDIQRAMATTAYNRLRIGIDAPPPGYDDPANWVLGRFTDAELGQLVAGLDQTVKAVELFVAEGITPAMNKFNQRFKQPTNNSAQNASGPSQNPTGGSASGGSSHSGGQTSGGSSANIIPPKSAPGVPPKAGG